MEQIVSFEALSPLLAAQLKKGVVTNCFVSAEEWRDAIAQGAVYAQSGADGLVLLRQRKGHARLYFYLHEPYVLPEFAVSGAVVTEVPLRPRDRDRADLLAAPLEAAGFARALARVRLSRPAGEAPAAPESARLVRPDEGDAAFALLSACFDPLTGCLPTRDELARDIAAGCLAAATDGNGHIASLLHFARERNGAEIRHLCTREDARGGGYAAAALALMLHQTGGGAVRVWTGAENTPALHFYKKNGFAPDGWTSVVLARR